VFGRLYIIYIAEYKVNSEAQFTFVSAVLFHDFRNYFIIYVVTFGGLVVAMISLNLPVRCSQ